MENSKEDEFRTTFSIVNLHQVEIEPLKLLIDCLHRFHLPQYFFLFLKKAMDDHKLVLTRRKL